MVLTDSTLKNNLEEFETNHSKVKAWFNHLCDRETSKACRSRVRFLKHLKNILGRSCGTLSDYSRLRKNFKKVLIFLKILGSS